MLPRNGDAKQAVSWEMRSPNGEAWKPLGVFRELNIQHPTSNIEW